MDLVGRAVAKLKQPINAIAATLTLLLLLVPLRFSAEITELASNQDALQTFVQDIGWYGPLFLIGINIIQIVIAPVPGYAVYLVAGFLFGMMWGGVWGSIGMLLGGMLAMWLGRFYGRPLVQTIIGAERLDQWEAVTGSQNAFIWGVLLLSPIGDIPFFLAGLSSIAFHKVFLLTVITRVPAAFAAAAIGAGVIHLAWWQLASLLVVLAGPLLIMLRFQAQIMAWLNNFVHRELERSETGPD